MGKQTFLKWETENNSLLKKTWDVIASMEQ